MNTRNLSQTASACKPSSADVFVAGRGIVRIAHPLNILRAAVRWHHDHPTEWTSRAAA